MNILDSVKRTPCPEVAKPYGRSKSPHAVVKNAGIQRAKDSCMADASRWVFRQVTLEVVDNTWWITPEQRGPDARHQCGPCGWLGQPSSKTWFPCGSATPVVSTEDSEERGSIGGSQGILSQLFARWPPWAKLSLAGKHRPWQCGK